MNIYAPAIETLASIGLAASLVVMVGCVMWVMRGTEAPEEGK
jgi:hypothetical protein